MLLPRRGHRGRPPPDAGAQPGPAARARLGRARRRQHDAAHLDRHRLPERDADRQAARLRGGGLRRGRDLRARPGRRRRPARRRSRALAAPARSDPRPLPALPRRRGRHRGAVRRRCCTGPRPKFAAHAAPGHRHHAGLQQRRHGHRRRRRGARPPSCAGWATRPRRTACGSPTRRWPGAGSSTTTAAPGGSWSWRTTPPSASASTASTSSRAATTPPAIEEIPGEKIFFLQLADAPALTMDVLSWSRHHRLFPGEGSFDLAGVRGARARAPATPGRSRWRSSTTPSGRPTCCAPRSRRSGR